MSDKLSCPMAFVISEPLLADLRAWRAGCAVRNHVEDDYDAYCLDGGLGPGWYMTSDGRVLRDGSGWDDEPLREATEAEAFRARTPERSPDVQPLRRHSVRCGSSLPGRTAHCLPSMRWLGLGAAQRIVPA
jgi:hypothetical protein